MSRIVLGVTGTRNPISYEQRIWLNLMIDDARLLHHGACVGADEAAHDAAVEAGIDIVVHPPLVETLMMPREKWRVRDRIYVWGAKQYHARNRDIVNNSERMIALPDGPERSRSGTWYTVNYAVYQGKPVLICYPDGSVEVR